MTEGQGSRRLAEAIAGERLGPIDATIDRSAADAYLRRIAYGSAFFAPGGAGQDYVPCGALGNTYTEMLTAADFYYLNALQARCEEEYLAPIRVGEALTCTGSIVDVGTTKSGLVYADIAAEVRNETGAVVFRSANRLVVSPDEAPTS